MLSKMEDLTQDEIKALWRYRNRNEKKAQPKIDKLRYPVSGYVKDNDYLHLYVNNIRILTPNEYRKLRDAIPKEHYNLDSAG